MVALVIALALFARDRVAKVWRRLHPSSDRPDPDPSAFVHARRRLGVAPLRELFRHLATLLATPATRGAFHRGWRLMAIDGTILDLPDTPANDRVFGRRRNQRGPDPFPQLRLLARCELGTHVIGELVSRPVRHAEPTLIAPPSPPSPPTPSCSSTAACSARRFFRPSAVAARTGSPE